ncbi:hypothetical protein BK816_00830 [Boudabousia tangfeifanii]|uniref:Uncharacterized protein n=1 Tax=Boudabousia tangfeifanii TaxID=1912795 RepID=A0A1D9MIH9_9ACTO|nr:hypothetical protein [Boudabousia tangfeifanii]AOZ72018.1 hypothetical protein BK816_00830 [Boudabousia tangfeifanii]
MPEFSAFDRQRDFPILPFLLGWFVLLVAFLFIPVPVISLAANASFWPVGYYVLALLLALAAIPLAANMFNNDQKVMGIVTLGADGLFIIYLCYLLVLNLIQL